jgi:hypothetical protein
LGARAIRDDLETMGLVETWIDSRGREGRIKQVETTLDSAWVRAAHAERSQRGWDARPGAIQFHSG